MEIDQTSEIAIGEIIPGGILPTDFVHCPGYDQTCSRCRKPISEDEIPLLLWLGDGDRMLSYCGECWGV